MCTKETLELLSGFVWGGEEEVHLHYFGPKMSLKPYVLYICLRKKKNNKMNGCTSMDLEEFDMSTCTQMCEVASRTYT